MKKMYGVVTSVVLCLSLIGVAFAFDDVKKHPSCKYCGMDREKFAHSRIFIEYDGGVTEGLCSIHCAAVDIAVNIDRTIGTMWVGDYGTKKLVDVEKAFWVVGGSEAGVMTRRGKWAFENKESAEKFIKEKGGTLASFDEVIKAAYEDMYQDTKMIQERRKMRRMQMQQQQPQQHQHQPQK